MEMNDEDIETPVTGEEEDGFADFLEENADLLEEEEDAVLEAKDAGPEDTPDEADGGEDPEDGEDQEADPRKAGQERLAQSLAKKERELSEKNRYIRELESRLAERQEADVDLLEDRVAYVRNQIARGLGVPTDDPRVREELRELLEDLTFEEISDDVLSSNDDLRRQAEERRARAKERRDRLALERRMAELERREREAELAQTKVRVTSQLSQYLKAREDDLPYLSVNPDRDPAELVWDGLQVLMAQGHDLSTDDRLTAAVEHITQSLEAHYEGIAERLSAAKRRAKGIDEDDGQEKRRSGSPKKRSRGGGGTVTSTRIGGGRGSAPPRSDDEEDFETFMQRGLTKLAAAGRRRR